METPRKFISSDDDPSLRIESFAIVNLRGVSTKLYFNLIFTMQHTRNLTKKSISYPGGSKRSDLCLYEKLSILKKKSNCLLNKRSEIVSACQHKNRFQVNNLNNERNACYLNTHKHKRSSHVFKIFRLPPEDSFWMNCSGKFFKVFCTIIHFALFICH